jgi:hypothetical protein
MLSDIIIDGLVSLRVAYPMIIHPCAWDVCKMKHDIFGNTLFMKSVKWIAIFCFLLTACQSKKLDYHYPVSNATCQEDITWMTLRPGVSTRDDVIRALGKPDEKGKEKLLDGRSMPFYAYNIQGGRISSFTKHRIFFNREGRVDWIETIVADSDGQYHSIQETVNLLGDTLDAVYSNSDFNLFADFQYDILGGPDDIYVWSECGVAILALSDVIKTDRGSLEYLLSENIPFDAEWVLNLRYPEFKSSMRPVTTLDSIVLMKFLFLPTTFEDFMENYRYKIPYDIWDDYLDDIQNTIQYPD